VESGFPSARLLAYACLQAAGPPATLVSAEIAKIGVAGDDLVVSVRQRERYEQSLWTGTPRDCFWLLRKDRQDGVKAVWDFGGQLFPGWLFRF
jgi:hypothetical protein